MKKLLLLGLIMVNLGFGASFANATSMWLGPTCAGITNELKVNSTDGSNGQVTSLQVFLKRNKYLSAESTGYFGNLTKAAVILYQKDKGLTATGVIDIATKDKINDESCKEADAYTPPTNNIPPIKSENSKIDLKLGQTGVLGGISIKPLEVVSESRCPSGVTCSWAGTVTVKAMLVKENNMVSNETLSIGDTSKIISGITFTGADPYPKYGSNIKPEDYIFHFESTKKENSTDPSIEIVAKSKNDLSTYYLTVEKGDKIEFSGNPMNLKGVKYGKEGFTAAWKTTSSIIDKSCWKNRKFSGNDSLWSSNCKANKTGSADVYLEIYKDGKTYTSNKINIVVSDKNHSNSLKINSVKSSSTQILEKNAIYSGDIATVYGSGLESGDIFVYFKDSSSPAFQKLGIYSKQKDNIIFFVPTSLVTGDYDLYIVKGGKTSNHIKGKIIERPLTNTSDLIITSPALYSLLQEGQTYNITWQGGSSNETYKIIITQALPNPTSVTIANSVPQSAHSFTWTVPKNFRGGTSYLILQGSNGSTAWEVIDITTPGIIWN